MAQEVEPAPTENNPVSEPEISGGGTPTDQINGLPVHRRVTTAFLAEEGWLFRGKAGQFVALTAVKDGESVVPMFELALVDDQGMTGSASRLEPSACCRNLLGGVAQGRIALFKLPRDGQYQFKSSLMPSEDRVLVRAYRVDHHPSRRLDQTAGIEGRVAYQGEVDLYSLEFDEDTRLRINVEVANNGHTGELGLLRVRPNGSIADNLSPSSVLRLEPVSEKGSLLVVYADQVSGPFGYTLRVKRGTDVKKLSAGTTESGTLDTPQDSDLYFMEVVQGSTWHIELRCDEPLKAKAIAAFPVGAQRDEDQDGERRRPVGEAETGLCATGAKGNLTVLASADGTLYMRVLSEEGTSGTYHLTVLRENR